MLEFSIASELRLVCVFCFGAKNIVFIVVQFAIQYRIHVLVLVN